MNKYEASLINVHKIACENIQALEEITSEITIDNDKDKANFGNACIALHGFRMVADATEAMLINEGILKGNDGFYKKLDENEEVESHIDDTDNPEPSKPSKGNGEGE